jgi:GxxExxY protein
MSGLVQDATGNDLTYRIIGAAMVVHNRLGQGYKEEVYEKALAAELLMRGINAVRQFPVEVNYEGVSVALFYLDLLVENLVVVELKAFSHQLTNDERAQMINYLKATEQPVGLLFNFGRRKLEFTRVFPSVEKNETVHRLGRDNVRKSNLPDPT